MRTITWQVGSGSPTTINISDTATATEVRVAIQTALDDAGDAAASAGQQATVTLSAGEFVINGDGTPSHGGVHIDSNVTFQGTTSGATNQTTIKLDSAYTSDDVTGIVRTTSEAGVHDVVIKDLNVEGNGTGQGKDVDGIYAGYYGDGSHIPAEAQHNIAIENVSVSNCSRYGIDPHEQIANLTIKNSVAHDNDSHGFVLDFVEGGVVENNESYNNGEHGFALVTGSHGVVLINNSAHDNVLSGIFMGPPDTDVETRPAFQSLSSYDITIIGGTIFGNDRHGIELSSSQHVTVEGVQITANSLNGINIGNDTDNTLAPTSEDIVIFGNFVSGNTTANNPSYNAEIRVRDNAGVVQFYANQIGATTSPATYEFSVDNIGNSSSTILVDGNRYEDGAATLKSGTPAILDDPAVIGVMSLNAWNNSANNISYGAGRQYVKGNGGNDTIATGTGNDAIVGGDGNDTANGGDGDDALWGDNGNDTLDGGTGVDKMQGGVGDDTFIVDNAGDIVLEAFNSGSDLIQSSVTFSINANPDIENLTLTGSAAINGTGNTVANVMYGNTGSNTLSAGGGDDSVYGDNGHDTLNGSTGLDTLLGQNGADVLYGGASKDTLTGGNGNDTYKYVTTAESSVAGTGRDLITDFGTVSGSDDIIDLSGIDANTSVSGNQAFTWVGSGAFTAAGQIRYAVVGGNTFVYGSVDADTAAEFAIEITGTPTLTAADFIL